MKTATISIAVAIGQLQVGNDALRRAVDMLAEAGQRRAKLANRLRRLARLVNVAADQLNAGIMEAMYSPAEECAA